MKKFITAAIVVILVATLLVLAAPISADEPSGVIGGYGYGYGYEKD